jgi:AhpC/TSA family/Disulphide bond corrector protein DsbC
MYCRGQLVQLQHDLPVFQRAGLGLAAISYDGAPVLREFASRKGISFPLLADHESKVIRAFGVANRRYARGTLLDINTEQITDSPGDVPVYGVAYPSVFVIDKRGKLLWRFVSETDELRLTGTAILARSIGVIAGESRHSLQNGRIQITTTASNTEAGLGNRLLIGLEFKLPSGFHFYGPEVGRNYHGLEWKMDASPCWYQSEPEYPKPQQRHFAFEEGELPVYAGEIRVTRELVLKPVLSAADPSLFRLFQTSCLDSSSHIKASGVVNFQACDERQCYPPQSAILEWKFHFVPPDLERAPPELRREFEQ